MSRASLASALLAVLAAAAVAGGARAQGVPSPANSTVPACVSLVAGDGAGGSRAFGEFVVVNRDIANNPVPNALVVVDFSLIPELFLGADQFDPDMTVDCAGKKVSKLTDADGRAVFCILGGSRADAAAVTRLGGARIYANGQLIGAPTASAFDLDGQLGLGASDMMLFLSDFVTGESFGRSDFDCSGALGAGDLARWLTAYGSGTQVVSAVTACP